MGTPLINKSAELTQGALYTLQLIHYSEFTTDTLLPVDHQACSWQLLAAFNATAGIQAFADIPAVAVLLDAASISVYNTNVYTQSFMKI